MVQTKVFKQNYLVTVFFKLIEYEYEIIQNAKLALQKYIGKATRC